MYRISTPAEKTAISQAIVATRCWNQHDTTVGWYDIGDTKAAGKTSEALCRRHGKRSHGTSYTNITHAKKDGTKPPDDVSDDPGIVVPHRHDVVCGGEHNDGYGNIRYRQLVRKNYVRYLSYPKRSLDRVRVATSIVDAIQTQQEPPGRFLTTTATRSAPETIWQPLTYTQAVTKTAEALREKDRRIDSATMIEQKQQQQQQHLVLEQQVQQQVYHRHYQRQRLQLQQQQQQQQQQEILHALRQQQQQQQDLMKEIEEEAAKAWADTDL